MDVANGDADAVAAVAAAAHPAENGESDSPNEFKLKFCTVCASNQNRYGILCLLPRRLCVCVCVCV